MATNLKPNQKGVINGTNQADTITWTNTAGWLRAITVNGAKGNDIIKFQNSKYKNKLNGNEGNDTIYGGTVADTITGGYGNDTIYAGAGNDSVYGGYGNDTIYAGPGNDYVEGGYGDDIIRGVSGTNTLKGGEGKDKIYGGTGADTIYAGPGADYVEGGAGADIIYGGIGNDTINAGIGNNTIIVNKADGTDTILNGGGSDTIKFTDFANLVALKNNLSTIKEGNDLALYHGASDKVIIKNFFTTTSSVKYFMANNGVKISVDNLLNERTFYLSGTGEITGTKYNDDIFGSAENDTILAGNGNDTVNGDMGDDIINAGAGNNVIKIGFSAGNDTVISGGGNDTLLFESVVSLDDLDATIDGNDLIISDGTSSATLQNYMSGGHSVVGVQTAGDDSPVSVETVKHHIDTNLQVVNGTAWGDDIKTSFKNGYYDNGVVINAGAGNDIIRITNDSDDFTEINVGTGNDIISFEADDNYEHTLDIYFNKGDGNNTIEGLTSHIYTTDTNIFLNSPDLIQQVAGVSYISGNRSENDLILNVDGGETLTIENYYTLTLNAQDQIYAYLNYEDAKYTYSYNNRLNMIVYSEDDIIQTGPTDSMPDLDDDHKLMIVQKNGVAPTLNGDYNTYAQEGSGTQYLSVYGQNNRIYLRNNGTSGAGTDRTTVDVYSNNNMITVKGNGKNSIDMTQADGLTGNKINFYHGDSGKNNNYVWTSVGGETSLYISTTNSLVPETAACSIWSLGNDFIRLFEGTNYIDFLRNGEEAKSKKMVSTWYASHNKIEHAIEAKSINIANSIRTAGNRETTDIMFEHYASNRSGDDDYISLAAKDSNGNIYTTDDLDIDIYGSWETGSFDIDSADFAKNVSVTVGTSDFVCSKKLSEMYQLVDMSKVNNNYAIDSATLGIAKNVNVQGTTNNDTYTVSDIGALTKQYTLTEKGGSDSIMIAGSNNFRLFFDVDTDGNFGNDLYILQTTGLDAQDYGSEFERFIKQGTFKENEGENYRDANYICIKNAELLSSANVEYIASSGTSKYIGTMGYINAIKENIATWLNNYNASEGTSYDTVLEAIQDGAGNHSLFAAYTGNANDTWNANLYDMPA